MAPSKAPAAIPLRRVSMGETVCHILVAGSKHSAESKWLFPSWPPIAYLKESKKSANKQNKLKKLTIFLERWLPQHDDVGYSYHLLKTTDSYANRMLLLIEMDHP